jgi:hypothetical protein
VLSKEGCWRHSAVAGYEGEFSITLKTYFSIFAVLSVVFGIGFVLAPAQVLANYGVESTPALSLMSRLFGGTLLAMAVILWCAKDFRDQAAGRAALIGIGIADAVNLVVALLGVTSGTINALGWSTVLIYLCGALGAGYFLAANKTQHQAA